MFGIRNVWHNHHYIKTFNTSVIRSLNRSAQKSMSCQNVICRTKQMQSSVYSYRYFTKSTINYKNTESSAQFTTKSTNINSTPNIGEYDTLTEYQAYDMIYKLSDNDRESLSKALSKYESDKIKSKFQGNLLTCDCVYIFDIIFYFVLHRNFFIFCVLNLFLRLLL